MNRLNKILGGIFLGLVIGTLIYGGFLVSQKNSIKDFLAKKLPNLNTLGTVNLPGQLFGPKQTNYAQTLDPIKIVEWTNFYRRQENLAPLAINEILTQAAQTKTEDMFANQYFEHISPSGQTPSQLVLNAGYNYKTTGENLALGDFKDEKDLVDAWYASPGHRANILNKDYTEIGVAANLGQFEDRANTWISDQEFGRPAPNCLKPTQILTDTIKQQKENYQDLTDQVKLLTADAQKLFDQANVKIKAGNDLYQQTHNRAQAKVLWDEGEALRAQAENKLAQARNLETQMKKIYQDINNLVDQYNTQVNTYNRCAQ